MKINIKTESNPAGTEYEVAAQQPADVADQVINENTELLAKLDDQAPMEISPEVASFYQRYNLALMNWVKTHPGERPPVYVDPIDGRMKWANRAMRRKHQKGLKIYVHNYR